MYAIVRQKNGRSYKSMVFGYYSYKDYGNSYWIVLNSEKNTLHKLPVIDDNGLYSTLLITDSDTTGWTEEINDSHCMEFLPFNDLLYMVEEDRIPDDLLNKCIELDNSYVYNEYPEIRNDKDIQDLEWMIGNFHDGRISMLEENDDSLYLLFDGLWGCKLEIWFEGDISYDASSRISEDCDPYWFGGSIIINDGFIYLIDDEDATIEDIEKGWCYFKARRMKYHIIPD